MGSLVASSPLCEIGFSTYWTKLETGVYDSPLEGDEAESSGHIAMGNFI